MNSNLEKIALILIYLKKEINYIQFNKNFFNNKPELEGYYIDLTNIFKNNVYLIISSTLDSDVKKLQDNIFITFNLKGSIEEFIKNLNTNAKSIIDLLEQVIRLSSEEVAQNKKTSSLPLGYYEGENGDVIVDREKANLARKIFNTYANLRSMKQTLRVVGAQLPYAERTQFNIGNVSKVLHDERYKNMRPSIIPTASFNQAQEILKRNRSEQLIKGRVKHKKIY